jgi:plastocyanin
MIRLLLVLVLALVVAVPGFAATAGAAKKKAPTPKPKAIKVGDDFFSPKKLKVKKNTTIKWKWSADNADTHDVRLKKGPKGVK